MRRIVGGTMTEVNGYPWMVALHHTKQAQPYCGGSLINSRSGKNINHRVTILYYPRYVLSAGHCYNRESDIVAVIGEHDYTSESDTLHRIVRKISLPLFYNFVSLSP